MRSSDISAGASGREIHFLSCYIFHVSCKAQSCCSHLDILSGNQSEKRAVKEREREAPGDAFQLSIQDSSRAAASPIPGLFSYIIK